jgi:hypothetical protein
MHLPQCRRASKQVMGEDDDLGHSIGDNQPSCRCFSVSRPTLASVGGEKDGGLAKGGMAKSTENHEVSKHERYKKHEVNKYGRQEMRELSSIRHRTGIKVRSTRIDPPRSLEESVQVVRKGVWTPLRVLGTRDALHYAMLEGSWRTFHVSSHSRHRIGKSEQSSTNLINLFSSDFPLPFPFLSPERNPQAPSRQCCFQYRAC